MINRFKTDPDYRLDTMTHQFLPCLMQLKLSSEDDQAYISEIQRIWCLLLDKLERRTSSNLLISLFFSLLCLATERSLSLEEFLQRLLEQPIGQHYHSVSINKHQLVERYDDVVRDLIHRYPSFSGQQQSQPSVSIPIVLQQPNAPSESMPMIEPRGSSPM